MVIGNCTVSCNTYKFSRRARMISTFLTSTTYIMYIWSWTTLLYNKKSRIRTRALGALPGVSSGPLTAILRNIKIHFKPYHKAAQQIQINSKKNCQLFVRCASDKKEYQMSVLNAPCSSQPSDLPIVKCS